MLLNTIMPWIQYLNASGCEQVMGQGLKGDALVELTFTASAHTGALNRALTKFVRTLIAA